MEIIAITTKELPAIHLLRSRMEPARVPIFLAFFQVNLLNSILRKILNSNNTIIQDLINIITCLVLINL